jgi:hypothetical protein
MISLSIILLGCFILSSVLYAIFKKQMQHWIVSDTKRDVIKCFRPKPKHNIHIMLAFVDHFEPGNRNANPDLQRERVHSWVKRYPELASKHQDSDGIPPQHTFFFPPHYHIHDHLKKIVGLCSRGFGEVEMHLHHDRMEPWPDDAVSLKKKILDCIESFSRYGVFCLPNNRKAYGFIHGDWALCNSLKSGDHCGVNNEIPILKETGCYADFTFPICNEAQPKLANTIFYAQDNSTNPKGYNQRPLAVKVGRNPADGFMLIQGIIGLRWKSRTHSVLPSIEQSNIGANDFPFERRIDYWIKKGVHVDGKPNWIFIKIHTHGAREENKNILLGKGCDKMYEYLESKYNDGKTHSLHYVSAREMYNIIKAAEAGKDGNPNLYRNYLIPPYVYLPQKKGHTS